jgi:hypothetical protein
MIEKKEIFRLLLSFLFPVVNEILEEEKKKSKKEE